MMTGDNRKTLYSFALSILNETSPYSISVEKFKYTCTGEEDNETIDFCKMLKRNLAHKIYETGQKNSEMNNCRKIIEAIAMAMVDYIDDYPGTYSVVQHHRNQFGVWLDRIVQQYGHGMEYTLPEELQYENENQSTVVLLLKELHNRNGVTKKDLQERLRLKRRQIAKDLRKLDHSLIDSPETSDMSDNVPFRIGGQPVQVKISAERKRNDPGDKNLYYKTVNTLHPIVLQENMMQAATLIQALCRNYFKHESNISLTIATDIWYQLSPYGQSRIRQVFGQRDDDLMAFLEIIENDFPAEKSNVYRTERDMFDENSFSGEELLMHFVKVPGRRCNITLTDKNGTRRTYCDQSISTEWNDQGEMVYIAKGRDGEAVYFSIFDFFDIEECSNYRCSGQNSSQYDNER